MPKITFIEHDGQEHCVDAEVGQSVMQTAMNNMIAGIQLLAMAEGLVMGEKLGVDRKILFDVLTTSTAASSIMERSFSLPGVVKTAASSNGFKPGFMAKLMLKDMRLSQQAAQMAGTSTPLGAVATAAFELHVGNGHGNLDSSSIIKLIKPDVA